MRIKMKTVAAGPAGSMLAGGEYEVGEAEGRALVENGYATEVAGGASAPAKAPAPEAAALTGAPEKAEMPAAVPHRRRGRE